MDVEACFDRNTSFVCQLEPVKTDHPRNNLTITCFFIAAYTCSTSTPNLKSPVRVVARDRSERLGDLVQAEDAPRGVGPRENGRLKVWECGRVRVDEGKGAIYFRF